MHARRTLAVALAASAAALPTPSATEHLDVLAPTPAACEPWCGDAGDTLVCAEERCMGCAQCAGQCSQWCGASDATFGTAPMQCGLLWFTHVPKNGGTSIVKMLEEAASAGGWRFHDSLFLTMPYFDYPGWPVPPERRVDISMWETSPGWQALLSDLRQPRPRIVLHHHDGMPGLADLSLIHI